MTSPLFSPLRLRSGQVLPNRIAKAAMEEGMAGAGQLPDERLLALYRRWGGGGAGLLITGKVMVHAEALTGPGGVVLDAATPLEPFVAWAEAGRAGGAAVWMQINHPGRQVQAEMPGVVWGPSAVGVEMGRHSKRFGSPSAMTPDQIEATVRRFAVTAERAARAGFDGVQIYAAHGYLLSQFLSPLVNRRTDRWGGPLENRARMLLDVVRAVRAAVPPEFAVAVKLNSADFQRGGFDVDDARRVIALLEPLGVGGSGAGYCDDLAVEPLSSAAKAVTDPGYETGALTPWVQSTGTASSVVASNARSGTYALQTGVSASGAVRTVSGLTSSGTNLVVGWAKVATAGEEVAVCVKSFGGTETYLRGSTTSYSHQPIFFTTGVSTTSAGVYCYKNSGSAAGYCDDYSLIKLS
ncbi:hypothetical protein ACFZDK_38345 [Streptomyces sp. NPDC007901]|uniref:oxidoreductase n=1 Tax=Streptomyces sp. NPDC007901 TaxID=3364785 RepID=UPI0036E8646A